MRNKWTKDMIHKEALKYNSRSEFEKLSFAAYKAARYRKILDEVCSHMKPKLRHWDYESIRKSALEFNTRSEFITMNRPAYKAALRRGIVDEVCSHMTVQKTYWSNDDLQKEARKYDTRRNFSLQNNGAYQTAIKRDILDSICSHMHPQLTYWTDEMLADEADKFSTRSDFARGSASAYVVALNRGILDNICADMRRGKHGFDPSKVGYLYVVRLDGILSSFVGFGITNYPKTRISDHTHTCNESGFSLTLLKILKFDVGKDAYNLELKLKQTLPIVSSGVEGFKTEAVMLSDIKMLYDLLPQPPKLPRKNSKEWKHLLAEGKIEESEEAGKYEWVEV